MEIKIEHLCGYLPYGLKFQGWDGKTELCAIMLNRGLQIKASDMHNNAEMISLSKNMPVLIPLDKLTDEQYAEIGRMSMPDFDGKNFASLGRDIICNPNVYRFRLSDSLEILSYLYSIKADIHGLIEQGNAIDAYTLETSPYQ